jgi:GNAT superfamily N-acetyltransferase
VQAKNALPDELDIETFRFMTEADIDRMCDLGNEFFNESEFPSFSTFSREKFADTLKLFVGDPDNVMLVFAPGGTVQGFIGFGIAAQYTEEPLALGWLLYVTPKFRKTPAGRILMTLADDYAREAGCCAFYMGCMAGIDSVAKSMPNMLTKLGYEPLFWGRKILETDK